MVGKGDGQKKKPPPVERRNDALARNIAKGVVSEMESQMGVSFAEHNADHSWVRAQRILDDERALQRKEDARNAQQLRRDIKNALIMRFVIPGLATAFMTALFGQSLLTKIISWFSGHGFQ